MKYCANCGQQLQDDDRFCEKCGTKCPEDEVMVPAGNQESGLGGPNLEAPNSREEIAAANQPGFQTGTWTGQPDEGGPITPVRQKRRWPYFLAGMLGVLLVGAVLLYHFGNFAPPDTPALAPADTDLFICMKPNILQVRGFSNLQDIYQADPETKKALEDLLQEFHQETDIDFEADIKPWLGNEAAAFMPRQEKPEELVVAIKYRDDVKARAFISKLARDANIREEIYRDTTVTRIDEDFMVALVNGFMLWASDEGLLHSTMDRQLGDKYESLADNADYKKVANSLPWNRSAFCFVNMQEMTGSFLDHNLAMFLLGPNLGNMFRVLDSYQGMGMSLAVNKQGIRCDYVLTCDQVPECLQARSVGNNEVKTALKMLPADSLGFVRNSYLLNLVTEESKKSLSTSDMREFENEFGVDFESGVLDLIRGDIAIAVMPQPKGPFLGDGNVPVSGVALLGIKDQAKAGNTVRQIAYNLNKYDLSVDRQQINGNDTYIFSKNYHEQMCGLGLQDNMVVLGSSAKATKKVMERRSGSISKQKKYKQAFAGLPGGWEPCMYLDLEKTLHLLPDEDMDAEEKMYYTLFKPVKSIGQASSAFNDRKGLVQGAMVVTIE
jgi:hypothetical protein